MKGQLGPLVVGSDQIVSPHSGGWWAFLGDPRSDTTGKRVKREVIIKGEPEHTGEGNDREKRRRRDPASLDLSERLDRDASSRCHFTEACRSARVAQNGTEASTAFDFPRLQRVSDHAHMIIPV